MGPTITPDQDMAGSPPPAIVMVFDAIGRQVMRVVNNCGAAMIFLLRALVLIFNRKQPAAIIQQVHMIGVKTINIVALVGFFTGMVMGLQLYYTLVKYGSAGVLGAAVALALIRELGPVLTAIMITARAGSSMTAEIGIQRNSEQIDALYTMRIDPIGYLISPKIAASIISFPILTALFDLIGLLGGYVSGVLIMGVNSGSYFYRIESSVLTEDITGGFIKSLVFAVIVSAICCYQGYFTHMRTDSYGARSVSLATTSAVVLSCVSILAADYVVTAFLM
ncbi:MAG: MlaE family lipid ABC transporter permease subunit [Desulfobacterales bacterium]|nr:MlaE family lipid ABC transporter permease subunit [Desulfobacterales bacterium]